MNLQIRYAKFCLLRSLWCDLSFINYSDYFEIVQSYAESSQTMNLEDSRDHVNSRDASGPSGDSMPSLKSEGASSSNGSRDAREGTNSTPLGLGLGGLERKVRFKYLCFTW